MKSLLEEVLESDSGFQSVNSHVLFWIAPIQSSLAFMDSGYSSRSHPNCSHPRRVPCASAHFAQSNQSCVIASDPARGLEDGIQGVP